MRRLAAILALGVISVVAVPATAAPEIVGTSERAGINWRRCPRDPAPFECATVTVPLDHDRPMGRQIKLALARLPAARPMAKVGSIFLNPGGPGGSGVDFLLGAGPFLFSPEVRARFDLVGFDPRGIRRSSPLRCFSTPDEAASILPPFAFPVTAEEESVKAASDVTLNAACEDRAGPIVDHMATADVARDLDLLRQKVGDRRLSYAGYSYGSFLGVTYANLFPNRVRAVVVDGVLDPIAWTTGYGVNSPLPFSTRLRSDAGARATLGEFFRLCDDAGTAGCAIAGDSANRFAALADRLLEEPVVIIDPVTGEQFRLTYADLVSFMLSSLYSSQSWASTAGALAELEALSDPAELGRALLAATERTGLDARRPRYRNDVEGGVGVFCSDSENPDDHSFWSAAGASADANFGYFGRSWTWVSSPCAVWTGSDADRFMGPFDRATANPVLVVGTRFDPATRYQGARIVHGLLPNSSLLTVEGWGHTSLFLSRCADRVVSSYLLSPRPPVGATTCRQDVPPFGAPAKRATDDDLAVRDQARRDVMSEVALVP